jgi:hypothetical protein
VDAEIIHPACMCVGGGRGGERGGRAIRVAADDATILLKTTSVHKMQHSMETFHIPSGLHAARLPGQLEFGVESNGKQNRSFYLAFLVAISRRSSPFMCERLSSLTSPE